MGRFTHMGVESRQKIEDTVKSWRENCLIGDGSLLFDNESVWTRESAESAYERFNENIQEDKTRTFEQKLEQQLDGVDQSTHRYAAEALLIYWLPSAWQVHPSTKRSQIETVLGWGGDDASGFDELLAWDAMDGGVASAGSGYMFNRWRELGFIFDFVRDLKQLDEDERRELLSDSSDFKAWIDDRDEVGGRQFRHILLNLLWPDEFERIDSGAHKTMVTNAFADLVPDKVDDLDDQLAAIRHELRRLVPLAESDGDPDWMPTGADGIVPDDEFDFYRPPVVRTWWTEKEDDLPALLFKKGLVLYGPPGTGKTFEANQLAGAVIRREALRGWGPSDFFKRLGEVNAALIDNVHRLQLHPAYSYEDFIGGLRMTDEGGVQYQPGFLPSLCRRIDEDSSGLPHVLIIDEMNRADLSRMFGEAFSAIEREKRGTPVELSVGDPETGRPRELVVPENLYVIGTMNMIDQSVEQIDFAMRRRFLWQESRFSEEILNVVLEKRWKEGNAPQPWEKVASDMQFLAESARRLNETIASTDELGDQYEIGHTYFFDSVEFLKADLKPRASTYFWTKAGEPKEPLIKFWKLALQPLIDEYLAGLEVERRKVLVAQLWDAFSTR